MAKSHRDSARVIAPPPLIYLGFLALGLALHRFWPAGFLPEIARLPFGAVLIASGLVLAGLGFRELRRVGTNIAPHLPSTALATGGVYGYTRNPLYVALTLFYLGIAAGTNDLWQLLLLAPLLVVMRHGVIGREERYLEAKFGDAYRQYKQRVRRWV
ncbi:MAG TPA: isoprenylcysteine carboxylmethyltransferase family protein [Stellaceae bacterium]|nr:isoprenylcysteine carboxylmethyltransferase family protein [Stellaceae bacterium]